jgi:glutamate-1-semialdehyde 2,1-aminomutase
MAAGITTLGVLQDEDIYSDLAGKCQSLLEAFQSAAKGHGVALQTVHFGGMFGMFFADRPVRNYDDALATDTKRFVKFVRGMLAEGIYLAPSPFEAWFMSTAHSGKDLEDTAKAAEKVFGTL